MNLIEARKAGHEGWVRSPSRTGGHWWRAAGNGISGLWANENDEQLTPFLFADLDAEDWEPKPKPVEPWEGVAWVHRDGRIIRADETRFSDDWEASGWRKIRVREIPS
jgi:hypothetical protein